MKACGVCRTDLHVVDGELTQPKLPLILGHEIVGIVEEIGERVERFQIGDRVGVPWLGGTCGQCRFCQRGQENLCEAARFTGIPLARNETAVYLLSACCAGLAGIIQASQLSSGEPSAGQGFELNAIAAAVVGGTSFTGGVGSIPGTLLGAVIIGILDKGLNQAGVHFSLQSIVKGLVILGAVYLDARRRRGATL